MEDEDEKSFCYVEGTAVDKNASLDTAELHENVWYGVKPPKQSPQMYNSFVSARQIELIHNILLGKTALKNYDSKVSEKIPESPPPPRRDEDKIPPSLNKRKSSVRFLTNAIYD